jgi:FkbM family methyltransferase
VVVVVAMDLKAQIRRVLHPIAEPLARKWYRRSLSFSASGEDRIVLAWLEMTYGLDVRKMRYCEIGANHPTILSNTFLFYGLGAKGVLIEPDPDLCAGLASERPRDTVLNVGIAFDEKRSAKLHRMTSRVFNTFSADQADRVIEASKDWVPDNKQEIIDEIEVPLVPANEILSTHFTDGIDFISIDTEGVDFQILNSIDLARFRPKMICIEATADFSSILGPAGYLQVAQTPDNLVFRLLA